MLQRLCTTVLYAITLTIRTEAVGKGSLRPGGFMVCVIFYVLLVVGCGMLVVGSSILVSIHRYLFILKVLYGQVVR